MGKNSEKGGAGRLGWWSIDLVRKEVLNWKGGVCGGGAVRGV